MHHYVLNLVVEIHESRSQITCDSIYITFDSIVGGSASLDDLKKYLSRLPLDMNL